MRPRWIASSARATTVQVKVLVDDDGDLRPGMQVDAAAAFARDGAADDVDDAEHAAALALDLLHRRERVERLARLADGDVERVLLDHGIAVAELRGRLGVRGNARQLLDQVRADAHRQCTPEPQPRIFMRRTSSSSRAASVDAAEMRRLEARLEAAAERAPHRLGLLGDLLAHVVVERALVEGLVRPGDRRRRLGGAGRRRASSVSKPSARTTAISPSSRCTTLLRVPHERRRGPRRTNISLSPMPSTTGLPLRATTMDVGPLRHRCTARPYVPVTSSQRRAHRRLRACRPSSIAAIRCASTSVSVSELEGHAAGLQLRAQLRRRSR